MKRKRISKPTGVALIFLLNLVFVTAPAAAKVPVVASIFPVADMVRQVGGPHVEVSFIIPAGASPHTFEPRPSQIGQIAAARVFFIIGAGLEMWIRKFAAGAGEKLLTVTLSDGVKLIRSIGPSHEHGDDHAKPPLGSGESDHAGDDALPANPHIWLDPVIAQAMVARIVTVLCSLDNLHADHYRRQGAGYLKSLAELDGEIRSTVSDFSLKKFVAFHSAWEYFAQRYGLEAAGIIENAPGRNPTPRQIKQIIDDVKKYNIRAVFAEPQLNPKVAAVIAREAGARVLLLDPMGAPAIEGRRTYLELMRYNLNVLREAMQ